MTAKLLIVILFSIVVTQISLAVPDDVFEVRKDTFAYADYPDVFDDVSKGITIETWISLNRTPESRVNDGDSSGNWLIFGKPGSYIVTMSGRDLSLDHEARIQIDFAFIGYNLFTSGRGNPGHWTSVFPESYLTNWVHIALQFVPVENDVESAMFYDGKRIGKIEKFPSLLREDSPFMLGGPIFNFGREYNFESMEGYIDSVLVSKGIRYEFGESIEPVRSFVVDDQTIALWEFEEGKHAYKYHDSSGNGFSLSIGGVMSVGSQEKLPTTWGRIKSGGSY